ncbi:LEAF RUST 10 DISEASE-RESISTANCE LOCUS RECEPTOR-LIKE PROTEIN KINASE-like 2.5 [Iris pallida]|uniref:LEAF RUST 10 DISEASE-RESISTANCE LOCUS RECEPTOR-LIKE PROTEIN KINASE-like 2.5 n=1 Tax=Iris pallida TaxID=29817 RepID=A0AAX6FCJ7_IRIPA|nr:LEAF RUST 10 DISEASE-RESISTANCE LOCUS RECEPTOR-LIKE PROTEIN KINASE-like 2.5 [Iris pallida]
MMRPTTSSAKYNSRRFLSSCLFFLLLFFHRRSQGRQHEDQDGCPSKSCGNISISYPFRLRGGDSSACTDPLPLFELVCEANKAVLYDHHLPYENRYYVKEISYDNMTVRLVDADLASGDCRLPRRNSSVDMYTLLNGIRFSEVEWTWVTFVSCSRETNGTRDRPYIPLPCLSTNDTNIVYAIFGAYSLDDLEPSCHSTAFTYAEYTTDTDPYGTTYLLEQSDFFKLLQKGFLLSWDTGYYKGRWRDSIELLSAFRDISLCTELISSPPLTMLDRVLFLFHVEANFFSCLAFISHPARTRPHNFYLAYSVAVILVVLLDIVLIHCIIRFIVVPVTVLVFLAYKSWRSYVPIDLVEKFLQNQGKLSPARYSYLQLVRMTDNFRDKLGQGGFGSVRCSKGDSPEATWLR